jgi:hypothetical protein
MAISAQIPVSPAAARPKASILVPVFNTEATLRQCLDSALAQTLHDIEIVCVDDGSPDGSPAILAEYAARDPRLAVVRQENAGLMGARKTGVGLARGEWCTFLDSDDWLEPDACERLVALAEAAGADMASCGCILHREGTPPEELLQRMEAYLNPTPWSGSATEALPLVFRERVLPWNLCGKTVRTGICKAVWAETSGVRVVNYEDACMMFRILLKAGRVVFSDEKRYHYRIGNGISTKRTRSLAEVVSSFGVVEEAESILRAAGNEGPAVAAAEILADTVAKGCCGRIMGSLPDKKDRAAAWAALAAHPCRERTLRAFAGHTAERPRETVDLLVDTSRRLQGMTEAREKALARLRLMTKSRDKTRAKLEKARAELARLREARRHPVRWFASAVFRRLFPAKKCSTEGTTP